MTARRVALRASVSVLVPLLVLLAADRLEWSIFATFGAFTSLYGRERVGAARLQLQARLAVYLTAAIGVGTLVATSPDRAWWAIPVAASVAALGSFASDAEGWHPPGPLFLVFACAACAAIPSTYADLPVALGVGAGSAAFSVVVGNAGAWWRQQEGEPAPRPSYRASLRWHVLPCSLGVFVAGSIATGAGIGHPYWAMVSAVVPLVARDFRHQVVRGLHRVVGTAAGLVVAAGLLALDLDGLAVILVVALLQALAELVVGRTYALALVAITPLALLMVHLAVPVPTSELLADRGVETVIGVAAGLAVGYLTRVRYPRS
ncbi:FUSC family protein [Nocardioides mangrovi]|uniref:FUSC family protein n=1 Tax=Nocardioides mangrovi TaxID=2874580 RepID=A0ABS7U8A4_9ACTN|nr:FUSC family protein [Nocardioides mangrovi]MBZ5737208.1 FUSC family protein [Nocardioides mangrovi]